MSQDDEGGLWQEGYVAHRGDFTHDSVGVFAEAMKYVALVSLYKGAHADTVVPADGTLPTVGTSGSSEGSITAASPIMDTSADGSTKLTTNSPAARTTGGIDFRNLPIVIQSSQSIMLLAKDVPLETLRSINLREIRTAIDDAVNSGVIPAASQIKEYAQASSAQGVIAQNKTDIIRCIAEMLRLEEENYSKSDVLIKDILIVLDAGNSEQELEKIFLGREG